MIRYCRKVKRERRERKTGNETTQIILTHTKRLKKRRKRLRGNRSNKIKEKKRDRKQNRIVSRVRITKPNSTQQNKTT